MLHQAALGRLSTPFQRLYPSPRPGLRVRSNSQWLRTKDRNRGRISPFAHRLALSRGELLHRRSGRLPLVAGPPRSEKLKSNQVVNESSQPFERAEGLAVSSYGTAIPSAAWPSTQLLGPSGFAPLNRLRFAFLEDILSTGSYRQPLRGTLVLKRNSARSG